MIRLIVTDSAGTASTADDVTIHVDNAAPSANAGAYQTVKTRSTIQLTGSGSDPDGDLITSYAWTLVTTPNKSKAQLSDTSISNPTITLDKAGDYTLTLVVTDDYNLSSDPVTVTLTAVNKMPK